MQKRVWKAKLADGMREEYIRRHDEIWPEMAKALKESGICNYTIWNLGDELIGYYECPDFAQADRFKKESDVMKRWSESMRGIMTMVTDERTGQTAEFKKVFELK